MLGRPGAEQIIVERGAAGMAAVGRRPRQLLHHLRDGLQLLFKDQAANVLMGEAGALAHRLRSEEHTSELQSLMRISYAVFCLKNKNTTKSMTHSISMIGRATLPTPR